MFPVFKEVNLKEISTALSKLKADDASFIYISWMSLQCASLQTVYSKLQPLRANQVSAWIQTSQL